MPFVACELKVDQPELRAAAVAMLRSAAQPPLLVLETCQRLECFGLAMPNLAQVEIFDTRRDLAAFERLARIAAGLESRILGELEILGQVRTAYRQFAEAGGRSDTALDRVFQDALSLARRARAESGIDKNMTSLSGLAARALMARVPEAKPVAVIGSGSLAGGVARYLNKRGNYPIRVSSRCPQNALALATKVGGFACGLDELAHLMRDVAGIITATAAPHPVLYPQHLKEAASSLIIVDMGVPPDCSHEVARLPDVTYIPLSEIEAQAQVNEDARRQCAERADCIIRKGALAWSRKR